MSLKIAVCIKQVSDPEYFSELTLDPVTGSIQRDKVPAILNPLDENALEEGLRIKEKFSGELIAITMGPPKAKEILEWALALGVDKAILLSDKAFGGADTLATARALAMCIKRLGMPDLIICGNQTEDGASGQVGPQLAEFLDIPHITFVSKIEFTDESSIIVKREIEHGGFLKIKAKLPALISVVKKINEVRDITAEGLMSVMDKELITWGADDIEADCNSIGAAGSPTKVVETLQRKIDRQKEILKGSSQELAKTVVKKLQQVGVL